MPHAGTFIVIPCYNEAACIAEVLRRLARSVPGATLVVVNDASTDNSVDEVLTSGVDNVVLLSLPTNLGIGGAVQTGLRYAAANGAEYAIKFDSDGQHPADQIVDLLRPLTQNVADMTIGSRYVGAGRTGFQSTAARRVGIRFFAFLNTFLTGQKITDNTSGFRGYNRAALAFAARHYPSFDYPEPEEVILMHHNHFRILEVSTVMQPRQGGVSSINVLRSGYYMIKVTVAILISACRPRLRKEG